MRCYADGQEGQEIANAKIHGRGTEAGGGNKGGEKQMDAQVFGGGVNIIW